MSSSSPLKSAIKKLPVIRWRTEMHRAFAARDGLRAELESARAELKALKRAAGFVPPGHFYSPLPAFEQVRKEAERIFGSVPRSITGLQMREEEQRALLESFVPYYTEMPFQAGATAGLRYFFENPAYSYSDGILLHCMIRHLKPGRIIEVGSGFSSCMTLDTNERFFGGAIETTFIEPYPELLHSLLKEDDKQRIKVIPTRLQDVDLSVFDALSANDILFVDSTHVSKVDSDVNRIIFEVLPRLATGVYIHFHDIFYPFEYPERWVLEGRAWNEIYLLRAFLECNREFQIVLMNSFMQRFHEEFFRAQMPLCLKNAGGHVWLRKL